MKDTVYVIGGDLRQITVSDLLKEENFKVKNLCLSNQKPNLEAIKNADIVILPMPVLCDGVNINAPLLEEKIKLLDVLSNISDNAIVFGGKIPSDAKKYLDERGIKYTDYLEREDLAIKNAIPTAEGAIEIAISEMPITLFDSNVLVVGYGRIGKVLSEKLQLLGANVTVSARKNSDFAWIGEKGLRSVHTDILKDIAGDFDLLINTVPSKIFVADVLENVRDSAVILDLASKPGGVDFDAAKALRKNVIWALSLPGKTAPITSGKIIKETIMNILSETEV